jgi:PAB1-binding protein PBP1
VHTGVMHTVIVCSRTLKALGSNLAKEDLTAATSQGGEMCRSCAHSGACVSMKAMERVNESHHAQPHITHETISDTCDVRGVDEPNA